MARDSLISSRLPQGLLYRMSGCSCLGCSSRLTDILLYVRPLNPPVCQYFRLFRSGGTLPQSFYWRGLELVAMLRGTVQGRGGIGDSFSLDKLENVQHRDFPLFACVVLGLKRICPFDPVADHYCFSSPPSTVGLSFTGSFLLPSSLLVTVLCFFWL